MGVLPAPNDIARPHDVGRRGTVKAVRHAPRDTSGDKGTLYPPTSALHGRAAVSEESAKHRTRLTD